MKRIFLMMVSIIALAAVYAVPVSANDSSIALTDQLRGCAIDDIEVYEPVSVNDGEAVINWVELHGGGWQILNASTALDELTVTYILPPGEDTRMAIHHGDLWQGECDPPMIDYVGTAISSFVNGNELHSGLIVDTSTCTLYDVTLSDGDIVSEERAEVITSTLASQQLNMNAVACLTMSAADTVATGS